MAFDGEAEVQAAKVWRALQKRERNERLGALFAWICFILLALAAIGIYREEKLIAEPIDVIVIESADAMKIEPM